MRATSLIFAALLALGACWPLAGGAEPAQSPIATAGKTISDPAESTAYAAASGTVDPGRRAAALEAFAGRYPASVSRLNALQEAMADYQRLNDAAGAERIARRILQSAPDDVRALAIIVVLQRARATSLSDADRAALATTAAADAGRGLKALPAWPGPEGMAPEAAAVVHSKLESIFYGALGFERLANADYAVAKYYYLKAVRANPADVQTDYDLAICDLKGAPLDPEGFWWAAKAYNLAGEAYAVASQAAIAVLPKQIYVAYHGGEDGWDDLLTQAATQSAPPDGFTVTAAASPAELAVKAVQDGDLASLTVPDWEFILAQRDASPANRDAADKVWAAIMAAQDGGASRLKLPVQVISANRAVIEAAITDDNRKAGRADLRVFLDAPLAQAPAPGTKFSIIGVISAYAPQPFAFTMHKARIAPD